VDENASCLSIEPDRREPRRPRTNARSEKYTWHGFRRVSLLEGETKKRERIVMRCRLFVVITFVALAAVAVQGLGADLEIFAGSGPTIGVASVFDFTAHLSGSFLLSVTFGGDSVQTGSSVVQTPSLRIGFRVMYKPLPEGSPLQPYVGAGIGAELVGNRLRSLLDAVLGVRVQLTPRVYLVGETFLGLPPTEIASRYWRVTIGIGIRF
jgi:hypothetical protein